MMHDQKAMVTSLKWFISEKHGITMLHVQKLWYSKKT